MATSKIPYIRQNNIYAKWKNTKTNTQLKLKIETESRTPFFIFGNGTQGKLYAVVVTAEPTGGNLTIKDLGNSGITATWDNVNNLIVLSGFTGSAYLSILAPFAFSIA